MNQGRRETNKSGYKGVYFSRQANLWRARIKVDGKSISLKYHKTAEDAHKAYCAAALELFGDFARVE